MMDQQGKSVHRRPDIVPMVDWYSLLSSGRHDLLSFQLLTEIARFRNQRHTAIDKAIRKQLNLFIQHFLFLFCHPKFSVPTTEAPRYVTLNATIAYLVGCSDFVNTDAWLRMLETQDAPIEKILALYSLRNRYRLPVQRLFREQPGLASHWYAMQTFTALPPAQRWLLDNARAHYRDMPDAYQIVSPGTVSGGYFDITYLEPDNEHLYKQKLNRAIRRVCESVQWGGPRNPKSVAVISRRWFPNSAVYRALYPYLQTLAGDYELTLVHLGKINPTIDTSLFSSVRVFPRLRDVRELNAEQRAVILDQDWTVAFFPDVGMDVETIYLGNCRLAPIQVVAYGHPASMHGGQIDYFIAGQDAEIAGLAQQYFTERLVLLPGIGMIPVWPTAPIDKTPPHDANRVLINCPWTLMKMHADLISLLREIIDECSLPVCFRFFTDLDETDQWAEPVYRHDLIELLGEDNFELHGLARYRKYLMEMAKGDMTIMAYPFGGGFNTLIDSLYVGLPAVTQEGTHGYNRFSAALLRKVGLGDLVALSREEFKNKILRLIDDTAYRRELSLRITQTDLEAKIATDIDATAFRRAIDYLIANHESLQVDQSHTPILIE